LVSSSFFNITIFINLSWSLSHAVTTATKYETDDTISTPAATVHAHVPTPTPTPTLIVCINHAVNLYYLSERALQNRVVPRPRPDIHFLLLNLG
jgi:hypothetical protein